MSFLRVREAGGPSEQSERQHADDKHNFHKGSRNTHLHGARCCGQEQKCSRRLLVCRDAVRVPQVLPARPEGAVHVPVADYGLCREGKRLDCSDVTFSEKVTMRLRSASSPRESVHLFLNESFQLFQLKMMRSKVD